MPIIGIIKRRMQKMKNQDFEMLLQKAKPMNLQFYAEGTGEGNESDGNGSGSEGGTDGDDDNDDDKGGSGEGDQNKGKTFTQEEVTSLTTREKKQGRKSAIKDLGFKSETEAKAELEEYRKWKESQADNNDKGKAGKEKNQNTGVDQEKLEALKKAEIAENKVSAIYAGVNKDMLDDLMVIARNKVTDEKDFDDVLEDMKKDKKYTMFFQTSTEGTGKDTNGKGGKGKKENIGERLAKKQATQNNVKSSYF